jgi:class 3 adenylate cyclase
MRRFGEWLWRQHARHFFGVLAGCTSVAMMALLGLPAVVVGAIYLDLTIGAGVIWAAILLAGVASSAGVIFFVLRARLAPIRRWTDGDRSDPTATWLALVRLPHWLSRCIMAVGLPVNLATSYLAAAAMASPTPAGYVGLAYAYVLLHLTAAVLYTSAAQIAVRPAAEEVGSHLVGPDRQLTSASHLVRQLLDEGGWTIRRRFVLGAFVLASLASYTTPLLVLGGAADQTDYLLAVAGGGAIAMYLVWLLDAGMIRPTITSVQDLIEGTMRVRRGDLDTPIAVSTIDELGDLAAAFNEMQSGLQERQSLRSAFGSYVDPLLASRLLESGSLVFEGEELEVSVLFADVRDFTTFAEGVGPAEAVALLNRLFDVVVPVIHEHDGHANHYLGDGLLAVFGAPQPIDRHADAAVTAAIEIQHRVRAEFGGELRIGIGINTGPVIAGTVGGGGRHEFTVIGDTVNVAARVEQLTKDTGDLVLVTEATRAALSAPRPRSTRRGAFDLRGKTSAVALHAITVGRARRTPPALARSTPATVLATDPHRFTPSEDQ